MKNIFISKTKKETEAKTLKTSKKFLFFKAKPKTFNTQDQIFKIVLTGILLAIAVATSLIEIRIPIMGALVPLRIFDVLIIIFSVPIIGTWYSLAIAIIEPWLHFALDSDHPPIQMVFDNIANIILVFSFILIFYKLFQFQNSDGTKPLFIKKTTAGFLLVPLNALISSLCFVLTLIILSNSSLEKPDDYIINITVFYKSAIAIFFILLAIELVRFILIYILFVLVQKKIGKLNRFNK